MSANGSLAAENEIFQDLEDLQSELIKLKLWTEEKCKQRGKTRSMETSLERSRCCVETILEGGQEELAEWDIVTDFIGSELAEFYQECEVSSEQ